MNDEAKSCSQLAAALAKAQGSFKPITKNREVEVSTKAGGKYVFRYATLDSVIDATRDALSANGLAQTCVIQPGRLTVRLLHESGELLESSLPIPDPGAGWQAFGSAVTYARRYLWSPMIGVAAEEDDDGNGADGNDSNPVADPKQPLWDALEEAGIMAKGKDSAREWVEAVLGRPIPTSDAIRETEVPLLIATAKGKLPMPKPKTPPTKEELAKALNAALDKLAPWPAILPTNPKEQAAHKKAAKLSWVHGMLPNGRGAVTSFLLLADADLQDLTNRALAGEVPENEPESNPFEHESDHGDQPTGQG